MVEHRTLREGILAGLIGATSVAIWFLVIDVIGGRPLHTPSVLGEALMNAVLGWCRDKGCRGVDSLALPGNRAAKNFFESFGLTARQILVHRSLEDDE